MFLVLHRRFLATCVYQFFFTSCKCIALTCLFIYYFYIYFLVYLGSEQYKKGNFIFLVLYLPALSRHYFVQIRKIPTSVITCNELVTFCSETMIFSVSICTMFFTIRQFSEEFFCPPNTFILRACNNAHPGMKSKYLGGSELLSQSSVLI
jgi:hypothetical protein